MKRYRIPLVTVAVAAAIVLPARTASAGDGLTTCSASVASSVIYATDGGVSHPTKSTATIDVSATLLKPASFYVHFTDGNGHHTSSSEQTSSTSYTTPEFGWSQWLSFGTQDALLALTEPLDISVVVTNLDTWGGTIQCQTSITLMPNTAPSAPTGVTATAGNRSASVTWTPWKTFTGQTFTVTSEPDGKTCTATYPSTSCTVDGLTNGKAYTFSVTTGTSGGTSDPSSPSNEILPSSAGDLPPTGNSTATLLWAALLSIAAGVSLVAARTRTRTRRSTRAA